MPNAFERWLLKQRRYCRLCTGPYPATRVGKINGKDEVLCDAHWRANHPIEAGYERKVEIYYQSKTQERKPQI